jgi:hypothetical protein
MKWLKKGVIFAANGQRPWMAHHASVPLAERVDDQRIRIYFSSRNVEGRSTVNFVEVDADDLSLVVRVHDKPVLSPGRVGAFDDSGVMPSCIVEHEGRKFLYYIGWNLGVTVAYRLGVGLAMSDDGGLSFRRVFEGPVVDRTRHEPFFSTAPFVLVENGKWRMWYVSCTGYIRTNDKPEPVYQVKYAESVDGYEWARPNMTCIGGEFEGEAIGRPCIVRENGVYRMWYCARGSVDYRTDKKQSYRIGYAESADGLSWRRLDGLAGIERSDEGWDSIMMEYPFVFEHRGAKHMLYCGNGFGETGFGYAVLVEDGRPVREIETDSRTAG